MNVLIVLLAIFGLTFVLKDSEGPFGIFSKIRSFIFNLPIVGTLFIQLFQCSLCLGFHCGYFIYLLSYFDFNLIHLFIWGLAGGIFSLVMDHLLFFLQR